MKRNEIEQLLKRALQSVVENHAKLFTLNVSERALTHQFALAIRQFTPASYDVDVEYNRHFDNPKRLNLPRRKASDREIRATTVFPDIIIHRRNTDENLLVLELKKPNEDLDYDELKLAAFIMELGYLHAAHVILGLNSNGDIIHQIIWHSNTS
jgi:hypothetical protein